MKLMKFPLTSFITYQICIYIYIYIYIVPPRNAKPQVCRNENGGHFEGVMAALMLGGSLPSQGYTNPECGDLGSPDRTPKRLR
jgi:hypothetical protein